MTPLNKDKLNMMSRDEAAHVAHQALHPIQGRTPEEMVSGVALLFATLALRCGLNPQQLFAMGKRMLNDQQHHTKTNGSLQSLKDFAGIKINGEEGVSIS